MDLRIIKTRGVIREAFLELRSKNPLEKIKVNRLCEMAVINKTTFYKHYQDVYALSDEIENETMASIMGSFEQMNSLFTDPDSFIRGLYFAFKSHEKLILTLFSGRMNVLIDKAEKQLINQYPMLTDLPEKEIVLSFLLRGASHVLMQSKYNETVLLDTVTKVTQQILSILNTERSFESA